MAMAHRQLTQIATIAAETILSRRQFVTKNLENKHTKLTECGIPLRSVCAVRHLHTSNKYSRVGYSYLSCMYFIITAALCVLINGWMDGLPGALSSSSSFITPLAADNKIHTIHIK